MSAQLTILAMNRELALAQQRIFALETALKEAADCITGEFCSHRDPCGAGNKGCYSQDFYQLLEMKWKSVVPSER
jgi:hypothetical protein